MFMLLTTYYATFFWHTARTNSLSAKMTSWLLVWAEGLYDALTYIGVLKSDLPLYHNPPKSQQKHFLCVLLTTGWFVLILNYRSQRRTLVCIYSVKGFTLLISSKVSFLGFKAKLKPFTKSLVEAGSRRQSFIKLRCDCCTTASVMRLSANVRGGSLHTKWITSSLLTCYGCYVVA